MSPDVSITRSASPRSCARIWRSLRIPSTTRSAGASGCRRRVASYRRTRSSSEASRNTIRASRSSARSSSSAFESSLKKTPPRASTTIATRVGEPGRIVELGHLRQQRRWQVVDDEEAEVLERACDLGTAGARQAGDQGEAVARRSRSSLMRSPARRRARAGGRARSPPSAGPTPGVAAISSTDAARSFVEGSEPLEQRLLPRRGRRRGCRPAASGARASRGANGGRRRRCGAPRRGCAGARTTPPSRAGSRSGSGRSGK